MKVKISSKEGAAQGFILKGSVDEIYLEDEKEITKIEKIWNSEERKHEWIITIKQKQTFLQGQLKLHDEI